jgi:hypothetical protein
MQAGVVAGLGGEAERTRLCFGFFLSFDLCLTLAFCFIGFDSAALHEFVVLSRSFQLGGR